MIYNKLNEVFDFVGAFDTSKYSGYEKHEQLKGIQTIFVVGLSYPNKPLPKKPNKFVASMYTYGYDYHDVIKTLMKETLKGHDFISLVDNHELDEQKCLEITGLAYKGKNNLMINKDFGSFFFIGLVLTKDKYPEVIVKNNDSCGDCNLCIRACPVQALLEGFNVKRCMSANNQTKKPLPDDVINNNYTLLGCDICQIVCPKNRNNKISNNNLLDPKPTAYVLITDLFELSNKEFNAKYGNHAYTWRGKTVLLRNALTLLLREKNKAYNDLIKKTITDDKYPLWYKADAEKILKKLEDL